MDAVLSVCNLTRSYGTKVAVNDISFSVNRGDILGLLGPNGAGKTTAIRIIMGILAGDCGEVRLFPGEEPVGAVTDRIGYLPEERGLYEDVTVMDNLVYLAGLKGVRRDEAFRKAMQWLEWMDLAGEASRKVDQLSKGMQQKIQFVAAVMHSPDLLVLDEPFGGLDPVNQDLFKDIIYDFQSSGAAILLSAHQMNVVEELCDSIFMIHRGERVLYGDLAEIKGGYHENIVRVRFSPGEDAGFLYGYAGVSVIESRSDQVSFRYSGNQTAEEILRDISRRLTIEELSFQKPPLHEIFVRTVRERGEQVEAAEIR